MGEGTGIEQEARKYSVLARQIDEGESLTDHCRLVEDTEVVPVQNDQLALHQVGIT